MTLFAMGVNRPIWLALSFRFTQYDRIHDCGEFSKCFYNLALKPAFYLYSQIYVVEWNQMNAKGEVKASGAFTYDAISKKLRFRSNESHPANTSQGLDLLMFFDEVTWFLVINVTGLL